MIGRFLAAVKKEFIQFSRDRLLIALIIWTYTVEVVICAYALSFEVRNLRLAVYDQDLSQISRTLVERFTSTEYFSSARYVLGRGEIDTLLDSGTADLGLVIPPEFSDHLLSGRGADIQAVLSGVNSNTANAAMAYTNIIVEEFSVMAVKDLLQRMGRSPELPVVTPQVRMWYNPELEFRYFMVISMIVVASLLVGIVHVAATMVREKETGTIEQIVLTPLKGYELIGAKLAPTLAIGMFSLLPSLAIAWWFRVPMKGSVILFFLTSALFLFTSMGIGVFISTFSRNLQQALLIAFFVVFPLMFLSGTIVPIESMPKALQYLSNLSPLRFYMETALAIFLKGVGISILWPKLLVITVFSAVIFPISLLRLRRVVYG